ncbi:hypothetical protein ACTJJ4_07705 [Microbacterium sp. 22195]|uniref:hypothetical protein n=1 Tax=Microbacterium sp. 22195 TaxID=3453891 RepID=UPI003F82F037
MYSVNGVPLDNEEMGWRFRAPSQPLSGLSRERTTLSAAGRDGVISVPGATFGAVGLPLMVQTPRAQHEALVALFAEDGVLSLTDTPTRQARFEFLASSPAGHGAADEVIDVTCTIRLIDATWRDVDVTTFTAALSAASVPLSCWPAHPSGVLSQVRNHFTNPRLVGNGQRVTVWENLFTNPGFETGSGTIELRRNIFSDTVPASVTAVSSNLARWFRSSGSTVPATLETSGWWARFDAAGTAYADGTIARASDWGVNGLVVLPSTTYVLSFEMERAAGSGVPRVDRYEYTSTGTGVGGRTNTPLTQDPATGRWFTTFTTAATVERVTLILMNGSLTTIAATDWWRFRRTMMEAAPTLRPYFAPANTDTAAIIPDPDMATSFTGATNASPSIMTGVTPAAPAAGHIANGGSSACILTSGAGVQHGTKALRIIPLGTSVESHYQISGYNLTLLGAGKTYTALATVTVLTAQTGTQSTNARSLVSTDSVNSNFNQKATAPNVPGTYPLRITFTVPSTATWAVIRLFDGVSAGNGEVVWDDVTIVEGVYNGPHISPDAAYGDPDLQVVWAGAANASTARVTGEVVAGVPSIADRCVAVRSSKVVNGVALPLRLIAKRNTNDTFVNFSVPVAARTDGGTLLATRYQEAPIAGLIPRALWIGSPAQEIPPVNESGIREYRLKYGPLTSDGGARFYHGAAQGTPDVWWSMPALVAGSYDGPSFPDTATASRLVVDAWDGTVDASSSTRTTYESWDGGLSAPVQDAIVRVKGAVTGLTITDASGAWLSFPTIPAGQWLRVEGRRAFLTTTDVWTGGTDVSGDLRQGGPRRRFEITPKRGASPDARAGQLTVATGSRTGAVIEVRGRGAYLQAER